MPNGREETLIACSFWIPVFTLCRFVDTAEPSRKWKLSAVWEYSDDLTTPNKVIVPLFHFGLVFIQVNEIPKKNPHTNYVLHELTLNFIRR